MNLRTDIQNGQLKRRLAERDIEWSLLLLLPAVLVVGALFIYPFVYGVAISFQPRIEGGPFANYIAFFSDSFMSDTIWKTLRLALPVALVSVSIATPIAYQARRDFRGREMLVFVMLLPLTFGSILIAQGMSRVFSSSGWLNLLLTSIGADKGQFIYNYTGTFIAGVLTTTPFAFLLMLGFFGGIDRRIEDAAATLGANRFHRFWRITFPLVLPGLITALMLALVEAFAIFPSAILVGQPDNATRVLTIPIYQAAAQRSDYTEASAIAVILTIIELLLLGSMVALRNRIFRGAAVGGKG
ncbi:ABC transporter permease [Microbacterium sp. NPDC058389]|uniref:ABC transporter permease n=1 Tax=Microbacterium sp. NPDC058389 TaxID=3346475 RepID=UPI003664F483